MPPSKKCRQKLFTISQIPQGCPEKDCFIVFSLDAKNAALIFNWSSDFSLKLCRGVTKCNKCFPLFGCASNSEIAKWLTLEVTLATLPTRWSVTEIDPILYRIISNITKTYSYLQVPVTIENYLILEPLGNSCKSRQLPTVSDLQPTTTYYLLLLYTRYQLPVADYLLPTTYTYLLSTYNVGPLATTYNHILKS